MPTNSVSETRLGIPVVVQILNGDGGGVPEHAPVDHPVAALPEHVLGGEPAGGLLQLPSRVPAAPPAPRRLGLDRKSVV